MRHVRGFSLVELLTVLGLLAVIAAMVTPAIYSAQRQNTTSTSFNLLRGIHYASVKNARTFGAAGYIYGYTLLYCESQIYGRNSYTLAKQGTATNYTQFVQCNSVIPWVIYPNNEIHYESLPVKSGGSGYYPKENVIGDDVPGFERGDDDFPGNYPTRGTGYYGYSPGTYLWNIGRNDQLNNRTGTVATQDSFALDGGSAALWGYVPVGMYLYRFVFSEANIRPANSPKIQIGGSSVTLTTAAQNWTDATKSGSWGPPQCLHVAYEPVTGLPHVEYTYGTTTPPTTSVTGAPARILKVFGFVGQQGWPYPGMTINGAQYLYLPSFTMGNIYDQTTGPATIQIPFYRIAPIENGLAGSAAPVKSVVITASGAAYISN